jgi:hypothetical protein
MLSPIERPAQQTLSGGAFFLIGTRDKGHWDKSCSRLLRANLVPRNLVSHLIVPRPPSLVPNFNNEKLHPNSRSPPMDRLPPNDPAPDCSAIAPRPTHLERPAAGIARRHATTAQTQQALPSVFGPPQLPRTDEGQAQSTSSDAPCYAAKNPTGPKGAVGFKRLNT